MNFFKKVLSVALVLGLSLGPVMAEPFNPTGMWEASDGESRYDVSLCGDGTQLCAKLVWIRPDVTNERNSVYLNTYVVEGAKRMDNRQWRGMIQLYGVRVAGSVTRKAPDVLQVRGCAFIVLCEHKLLRRMNDVEAKVADR